MRSLKLMSLLKINSSHASSNSLMDGKIRKLKSAIRNSARSSSSKAWMDSRAEKTCRFDSNKNKRGQNHCRTIQLTGKVKDRFVGCWKLHSPANFGNAGIPHH